MASPPTFHAPRPGGRTHSPRVLAKVLLLALIGLGAGGRWLVQRPYFHSWVIRQMDRLLRDPGEPGLRAERVVFRPGGVQFHRAVVRGARVQVLDIGLDLATLFRPPHLGRVRLILEQPAAPEARPEPAEAGRAPPGWPRLPALPPVPALAAGPAGQARGPLDGPGKLPAPGPAGPEPRPHRLSEDNLMLFTVRLGRRVVAENFPGYPLGGKSYLLPLGEFCRVISIGITVDPRQGEAKGFIISENRKFFLDLKQDLVVADGKRFTLDRTRVERHPEDIYVDDAYLPLWLPLTLSINPYTAIIQVDPLEELPIQAGWRREELLGRRRPGPESAPFPLLRVPYAALDWPFLDQNLNLNVRPRASGTGTAELSGSTFLGGDLAWMSGQLFFTSHDGDLFSSPRGRLFRSDPTGDLLGPLKATIVEGGDFFLPTPALVGGSPQGRGFHIGNFPDTLQAGVDRYTLQGDLPPGWSVELYQNNILLDYQAFRTDGQYLFADLPLLYGVNDFRLAFYGPLGERREEHRRLDISLSQTPAGEFHYNLAGTRPGEGATHYLVETAYGLSRQMDVRATLSQVAVAPPAPVPGGGEQLQQFSTVSLQGYWPGFSTWAGVARSDAGGSAQSATLSTGWGSLSATLQRTFLNNYYSPEFTPTYGLITGRTRGQLSFSLPRYSWLPSGLNLGLEQQRDELAGGGSNVRSTARASMNTWGYYLANSVTWNQVDRPGAAQGRRDGLLLVSKSFQDFSLRGEGGYSLGGQGQALERLALQADTRIWRPWMVTGSVARELLAADTRYSLNALRQKGPVGIRVFASYSGLGKLNLGVGLHLSMGREPRTGAWVASSGPMAGSGAVSGLAYLDTRGTGVKDPREPAVEDAGLTVNGTPRTPFHPGGGAIFQPYLRPDAVTSVSLAEGTLEDPMVKPRIPGYRIVPRVGKTIQLDFPLVLGGEITGATLIQTPEGPQDLAGLSLELLDPEGRLKLQVASAFDGFFDLADLAPGSYTLRVAPDEAERLGVSLPPPRTFEITPRGSLFEGVQLVVTPRPAPRP